MSDTITRPAPAPPAAAGASTETVRARAITAMRAAYGRDVLLQVDQDITSANGR